MRLGEGHPKVGHGHVYWSMGVCVAAEASGCDWDRRHIVLFTVVKGDFLKQELHHVTPFLTDTFRILFRALLLALMNAP